MKCSWNRFAKPMILLLLLTFALLLTVFLGKPLLAMADSPETFRALMGENGWWARVVFVAMVCIQVIVALIPGEPLEICAGIVFGSVEGTLLCLAGIFIGSLAVFFLVRRFGVKLLELFFTTEKIRSLRFLQNERRLKTVLFLLMVFPGTPKDLISYFVPLTKISPWYWIVMATFARIPSVVTSTVGGNAVGEGKLFFAAAVFAVTCLVGIFGVLFFDRFRKKRDNK